MRLLQRQRVVHLVRTSGPLARADLADRLGLARSVITAIVSELLDDRTLVELSARVEGPGYRGRPRVLLDCNPQAPRVLGIWIDEQRARIFVAGAAGNVTAEGETPTGGRSPASVIGSIIEISRQLTADSAGGAVAAAGVCIPGFVDGISGTVLESNLLGWPKVEMGQMISRALGIPTAVQDATQAVTLAEAIAGQAREVRSAVVLDYGRRVGIGLIIDGKPYVGATGVAGSIGHIPAFGGRARCRCGRIGCIDAGVSLNAVRAAEDSDLGGLTKDADTFREAIDRVAHTAMFVEALIDPEVLIIAGLVLEFDEIIDALEARIDEIRPPERRGRTSTVRSEIGHMNTPGKTGENNYRVSIIVALQQLDPDIAGMARMR
ncbi:ROK family protein [Mycobacterium sp. Y57]|nr:ROK family protein [Mycolicibacterium xanthum]